ncbi:ATPase [Thioploca ingrica]|uniref:histidine kinase n=1 Tax=Thioploca ingrica TaxID=40754 RepID=A0A090ALH4_9GAMM|nr:ATPase [Thioploca ingrica]
MLKLAGYTVTDQIDENFEMLMYRGYRTDNKQWVIIKMLKTQLVNPKLVARWHDEYELNRQLSYPGIVQVYDLQPHHHTWVLIMEDIQGVLLKNRIAIESVNLTTFLPMAIQLVNTLAYLHDYPIIYKNMTPANIFVNLSTGQVKITNFSLSSRWQQEYQLINPHAQFEEILTYLAPEQTGRVNRVIDYRTDFYLLGLVFYEMLVGHPPFKSGHAPELIDWHITKQPVLPSSLNANIPMTISNIIMKLLAKSAEDRYQSAGGLNADLQICLQQWQASNQIQPLMLGQFDIAPQLLISQKLYGRTTELNTLLPVLKRNRNREHFSPEIVLISGPVGIGKSALVKEIGPLLTQPRGYFIQGKFEPAQYPTPRSALVQAVTHLILQWLTESEVKQDDWRNKLLAALAPNAQLIIELVPALEKLIGKQPSVPIVGATAARNRFNWTWLKFIQVLCQSAHPLVIFLDDLQWADIATFELIELIITAQEINNLFFIGAYQEDEVNHNHPLMAMLNRLPKTVIVNHLTLTSLNFAAITEWLMATLSHDSEKIKPLAEWIRQQTQGNPLVIQQLLKSLAEENYLQLSLPENNSDQEAVLLPKRGYWDWDLTRMISDSSPLNRIELITERIKKLPPATQHLLCLAAAIGNQFDLEQLALIDEKSIANTYQHLLPALKVGLVIKYQFPPTLNLPAFTPQFAFYHDSIQQAAYAASKMNKPALHLRIGRLWLANIANEERINPIFAIVEHLNTGRSLLVEPQEILELARLNLAAGKKAKTTLAYVAAQSYLTAGMACITAENWREHKPLALDLYKTSAEVESLNGNVETTKILIQVMLAQTKTVLEQIEVYNGLLTQYLDQNQPDFAITVGFQALQQLQMELPQHDLQAALDQELFAIEQYWRDKALITLLDGPAMTHPEKQAAIVLLSYMATAALASQPTLFNFIHVKVVHLSLKYGQVAQSALSYAYYGLLLVQVTKNYQRGYELAHFALKLSQKFNDWLPQAQIYLILENLLPWVKSIKTIKMINQEGQQASLAVGDFQSLGHFLVDAILIHFSQGEPLNLLEEKITYSLSLSQEIHQSPATDIIGGYQLLVSNLLGKTENQLVFAQDTLTEEHYLTTCQQNTNRLALGIYQIFKAKILYLYGQFSEALVCSLRAEEHLSLISNPMVLGNYYCYRSLILLALFKQATSEEQQQYQTQIATHQQQLKICADACPDNFQHQYELVAAETARLFANPLAAMDLYDSAIHWAITHEFIIEAALANELAAQFWLKRDKAAFAQLYLTKAYDHYQHWGAKYKVENLLAHYPTRLINTDISNLNTSTETTPSQTPTSPVQEITPAIASSTALGKESTLNLMQIMEASQAISEEIRQSHLIKKIMQIVVEQAGAEQGWLILKKNTIQSQVSSGESSINNLLKIDSEIANQPEVQPEPEKNGELFIEAYATLKKVQLLKPIRLKSIDRNGHARRALSRKIITHVAQTQMPIVLNEASHYRLFTHDFQQLPQPPLSVLAMPILKSKQLIGIFYLENNLSHNAFTSERLTVLKLLATQIAISIENALFYTQLEQARFAEIQSRHLAEQACHEAEIASRAKTTFLTNMSHELRTPLNAILGYSEIIQEEAEEFGYEGILPDLERIQTAGIQLLGIISDILDISKIEADKMELNLTEFSVTQLVEDMVTTIQLMVETEGNTLKIQYDPDLGTLYADYHKVGQILLNLLNNASKFTRQGTITLTVTHETLFQIQPTAAEDDIQLIESEWIFFQITDTGIGIPPERIDSIFEAFTQADNSPTREYGGTGLGLTISDRLCRAMGGYITVNSEVGKGSTFTVQLPTRVTLSH